LRHSAPTLLVIEDARDEAMLAGASARRCYPGLQVRTVRDGFEGVAYLAGITPFDDRVRHPLPDLMVLDFLTPGLDGFAVLEWVRSQRSMASVPVIVLISWDGRDDEGRAYMLGASRVYRKPKNAVELETVVRELVESHISPGARVEARSPSGGSPLTVFR